MGTFALQRLNYFSYHRVTRIRPMLMTIMECSLFRYFL